jgi:DNA replication and repair protein RecF
LYVKELSLKGYRNYKGLQLNFNSGIHLFIGDNAQGKTNILEALYVLALAKSHRTNKEKELIKWDEDVALLACQVEKKYGVLPLHLHITAKGKKAKVNHLEQRRLSEYIGMLNVVMFAPEDLELIKGNPQVRRRFIDMEIGQMSSTYLYQLSMYHKLLIQRNSLLKQFHQLSKNRPMIDIFTEQLCKAAANIIKKRIYFLKKLQEWAQPIHLSISNGKENLSIEYVYSIPIEEEMTEEEIREVIFQKFDKIKDQEERRGTTLIGPHRDDLQFIVNTMNVQHFGSQGQQRTAALSIKLAEIELMRAEIGEYPILLLDDVFSELDHDRRTHLLATIENKVQTFVTNTSTEGIDKRLIDFSTVYKIEQGTVKKISEES